jgi:hypothetical protein
MEDMLRYIFSALNGYEENSKAITKKLHNQKGTNYLLISFSMVAAGLLCTQHKKLRDLDKRVNELERYDKKGD